MKVSSPTSHNPDNKNVVKQFFEKTIEKIKKFFKCIWERLKKVWNYLFSKCSKNKTLKTKINTPSSTPKLKSTASDKSIILGIINKVIEKLEIKNTNAHTFLYYVYSQYLMHLHKNLYIYTLGTNNTDLFEFIKNSKHDYVAITLNVKTTRHALLLFLDNKNKTIYFYDPMFKLSNSENFKLFYEDMFHQSHLLKPTTVSEIVNLIRSIKNDYKFNDDDSSKDQKDGFTCVFHCLIYILKKFTEEKIPSSTEDIHNFKLQIANQIKNNKQLILNLLLKNENRLIIDYLRKNPLQK